MKVLLINGSPHIKGCTARALEEIAKTLKEEGIETETIQVGSKEIRGCISCNSCAKTGRCVFDDIVNEVAEKFKDAEGIVFGSPTYYASANGTLRSFLDRLFYSTNFSKRMKVGAAVVSSRRAGSTTVFDELNKYFTISGMPVASGQYWNSVHGAAKGEAEEDKEGLQGMRTLARNAAFLMKSIALGKEKYGLPEKEAFERTNFIR